MAYKRLKQANMWVISGKLRNIKNKEKGLIANIGKLGSVVGNTNKDKIILQPIYIELNNALSLASQIKKSPYKAGVSSSTRPPSSMYQSSRYTRQAGGKKTFSYN